MTKHSPTPRKARPPTGGNQRLALEHYDPGPLRRIAPSLWKRFVPLLEIPPTDTVPTVRDPENLLQAARGGSAPKALDFLQMLHDFGNEVGRHVLHDAAISLGQDRGDWPPDPEDLATELWCRAVTDPDVEQLRAFAEVCLQQRTVDLRHREYYGCGGTPIDATKKRLQGFREVLSLVFAAEQMGATVKVRAISEDDRVVICVFHGSRWHHVTTLEDDGDERLLSGRPLVCDVLAYEEMTGKLYVTARSESLAATYRAEFGRAFFGGPAFFAHEPTYDLAPFVRAVREGALPPPGLASRIREVALVDCTWATPEGFRHHVHGPRGRDCIPQLRRARFGEDGDVPLKVILAFFFREGTRMERTDVVLRPSNQFDCPKALHREAIAEYLERIHVYRPAEQGDGPPTREPLSLLGVQSTTRWKHLLGDRLQEAIDLGLLRAAACSAVSFPDDDHPLRTDPITEIETSRGVLHVAVDSPHVSIVEAGRAQGFELDLPALSEALRQDLRCEQSASPLPFGSAIHLGPAQIGNTSVLAILLPHPGGVETADALKVCAALAGGAKARWIVLLPPKAPTAGWPYAVALRTLVPPFRVRADVVRALQLQDQVPVHERSNGEDLVVDHEAPVAWLHDVLIDLSTNEWKLLKLLAARAHSGRPVATTEINQDLSPNATSTDVAKQCVTQFNKKVREAFQAHGIPLPERHARIVESAGSKAGYRLKPSLYYEGPGWRPPTP